MRFKRIQTWMSRSIAIAGGMLLFGSLTASASAPSVNSDVAGAPRLRAATETASLAITVRTCPPGYDPTLAGADYVADCQQPAGDTLFHLDQARMSGPSASTGASGDSPQQSTVSFSALTAGRYGIEATAPAEIGAAFIGACTSNARSFDDYPMVPFASVVDGRLTLDLLPGETLTCDWYQIGKLAE